MHTKHVVILLVLLAVMLPPSSARAGGVVTICDEAHLRAALAGGGTVTFACSGTIILASQIDITSNTTVDGAGQNVTISGNDTVRVFYVNSGVTLNLNQLTIANGRATDESGGGLYNSGGTITVTESTFSGNSAGNYRGLGSGGGIANSNGAVTVNNSTFSGNFAFSAGGAIMMDGGVLAVVDSTFSGNGAGLGGGILDASNSTMIRNNTFTNNHAFGSGTWNSDGAGGGIFNASNSSIIQDNTFTDNSASSGSPFGGDYGSGGGIYNASGGPTIRNNVFNHNSARGEGQYSSGGGGGIYNGSSGTPLIHNNTFNANSADDIGGGIWNHGGTMIVSNNTFSGNIAGTGGGVSNWSGTAIIVNSTFSGGSSNTGGGIHNNSNGTVTLQNTIVGNSLWGGNCNGTITDGGGNLSYPDATCPGLQADPKLGPLQNNGGPTHTMALLPGSAALDAGNDAICAAPPVNNLDQRGITRPQGAHCDIGAYEAVQGTPPTPTPTPTAGPLTVLDREAENNTYTAPMQTGEDAAASACLYLYDPVGWTGTPGDVALNFSISRADNYWIWGRVMGESWSRNSFWVTVDGGSQIWYEVLQVDDQWQWGWQVVHGINQPVTPFYLSSGTHTIRFQGREPYARLDRVLLVNRASYVPVQFSPCATATPTPTATPTSTNTPTPTATNTPTATPTNTPTPGSTTRTVFLPVITR